MKFDQLIQQQQENHFIGNPKNNQKLSADNSSSESNSGLFFIFLFTFLMLFTTVMWVAHQQFGTSNQLAQIEKISEFIVPQKTLKDYEPSDFYWFSVSTKDLIINSNLDSLYQRNRVVYSINRNAHLKAVILTQLSHNINFNGSINVKMSAFDEDKKKKQQTIKRIIQFQQKYYDKQYSIKKYENYQLRFCIIIPSYNNVKSKLYLRNLDSIFMQDYHNYHLVYIDDHSSDHTADQVKKYIRENNIPQEKINIYVNSVNNKAMKNIYEKIHSDCPDGELVAIIDGDDSLIGRQVFKLYNALFHQKRTAFVYSNFLKIISNSRTQFGFGSQVTDEYYQAGYLRTYWPIVGTHFMSFYSDIFKMVKKEDFCYENGTFYDYAYDRAIITPLLELSHPRNYYLSEMIYEYRNDTGVNDGQSEWMRVSSLIQNRPPYNNLKQFDFIDNHQIIKKAIQNINMN